MPSLTWTGSRFEWRGRFEDRHLPKKAGFRWDPDNRVWWTSDGALALRLRVYADSAAEAKLRAVEDAIENSRASDRQDIAFPVPDGLSLYPFQRAGAAWLVEHPYALLGDEMGLGKTVQAVVAAHYLGVDRWVVVCPAMLRINWAREIGRWWPDAEVAIVDGSHLELPSVGVAVINYDVLDRHLERLARWGPSLVIIDEGHYIKNPKAKRTQAVSQLAETAKRVWVLTGTPIPNRPIELFPILRLLRSDLSRSWRYYVTRYCAAYEGRYGWDVSGASNLSELQQRLRASVMIRRRKSEVLKELPEKVRQLVVLPTNGAGKVIAAERVAIEEYKRVAAEHHAKVALAAAESEAAYAAAVTEMQKALRVAFEEIARARHELGLAKVPAVVETVAAAASDHKVVVWAHHVDVLQALYDGLREEGIDCVLVHGGVSHTARQEAVDRFQTDESCRVFIGGMTAAGVGLTLTAADHVIFAELDWVPATIVQAEDRCHRIGQAHSVLIQHLVYDGSLDAQLAKTLVDKAATAAAALDEFVDLTVPSAGGVLADSDEKIGTTPSLLDKLAESVTPELAVAALRGVQAIAAACDEARTIDGLGFSKADVVIGHSLAGRESLTSRQAALAWKLCRKYRRQLAELAPDVLATLEGKEES